VQSSYHRHCQALSLLPKCVNGLQVYVCVCACLFTSIEHPVCVLMRVPIQNCLKKCNLIYNHAKKLNAATGPSSLGFKIGCVPVLVRQVCAWLHVCMGATHCLLLCWIPSVEPQATLQACHLLPCVCTPQKKLPLCMCAHDVLHVCVCEYVCVFVCQHACICVSVHVHIYVCFYVLCVYVHRIACVCVCFV
jgi:hypothetical protein